MEDRIRLRLNDDQVNQLSFLPEQGMGYQIVDIEMKNGNFLKGKVVLNSTFLLLEKEEHISVDEIKNIVLSQR